MMKAYAVILTGMGDTDIKIVDKETYDWIVSEELGCEEPSDSSWGDKSCPPHVRQKIWDQLDPSDRKDHGDNIENYWPWVTIGSLENDRALQAPAIIHQQQTFSFYDVSDYNECVQENNIQIIDTYEGCIY